MIISTLERIAPLGCELLHPTTQLGNAREDAGDEALVILLMGASGRLALAQGFIACIVAVRIRDGGLYYCGHELQKLGGLMGLIPTLSGICRRKYECHVLSGKKEENWMTE